MKFAEWRTWHALARHLGQADALAANERDWYAGPYARRVMGLDSVSGGSQVAAEAEWVRIGRPYYSVWPLATASLVRVPLDLDASLVRLPLAPGGEPLPGAVAIERPILIRFPDAAPLSLRADDPEPCRAILAVEIVGAERRKLVLFVDRGHDILLSREIHLDAGVTIEAELAADLDLVVLPGRDVEQVDAEVRVAMRVVVAVSLLADDPSIVTPDVLADDRARYERTGEASLVERARRRGKIGWSIGERLTADPHYRRAHFALRWTGVGRTTPKIVAVRGAVVHRQRLAAPISGTLDADEAAAAKRAKLRAENHQEDGKP